MTTHYDPPINPDHNTDDTPNSGANGAANGHLNGWDPFANSGPNTAANGRADGTADGVLILVPRTPGDHPNDTAYEVVLDEEPTGRAVPVDPLITLPAVSPAEGARRPVIPPSLRPENLKATTRRAAGRAGHLA